MKAPNTWVEEYGTGGPDNDGYMAPRGREMLSLADMYRLVQLDVLESVVQATSLFPREETDMRGRLRELFETANGGR